MRTARGDGAKPETAAGVVNTISPSRTASDGANRRLEGERTDGDLSKACFFSSDAIPWLALLLLSRAEDTEKGGTHSFPFFVGGLVICVPGMWRRRNGRWILGSSQETQQGGNVLCDIFLSRSSSWKKIRSGITSQPFHSYSEK